MDAYNRRLKSWVQQEIRDRNLSDRKLALRMGVTHGAIQNWRKGLLKKVLPLESINAIAAYQGKSPEEVRCWLEGRPVERRLDDRVEVLERRVFVLEEICRQFAKDSLIAQVICEWKKREQISDIELMALIQQRTKMITLERFQAILNREIKNQQITSDDLLGIASIVTKLDGNLYRLEELAALHAASCLTAKNGE